MASPAAEAPLPRPLLTLGPVHRVRIQVGLRASPEGAAHEQFLLDLPTGEAAADDGAPPPDETSILAALEPVLFAGADVPRHYSVHQHRWHTSWGASPGTLEIGLLVTTGTRAAATSEASLTEVTGVFRGLLERVGGPDPLPTSRDAAVTRARRSAASAYAVDPSTLSLSAEEHHPSANTWSLALRAGDGSEYDVLVGFVDGYAGSVRVRHQPPPEVYDSVGTE